MAESRGIGIIRSGDTSILFDAQLFDENNDKIVAGTVSVRIWHVLPATAAFETYDFDDDTFKTGAITTPTATATHQAAENGTYNTGIWTYRHDVLTAFVVGDKYRVEFSHASLPRPIALQFQYGDLEGDQATLIPDFVWDENIVAAHGTASSGGLLLRVLGAAISTRSFNPTLNALLGVPDTAVGDTVPGQVWEELAASHDTVGTFGEIMNDIAATGPPSAADIADAVWDENVVAAHGTASTAGLLLRALGALISQRANNPTLNALLAVPDSVGATIATPIWEDLSTARTTINTSGFVLSALGLAISQRTNSPTLNALLAVPDVAGANISDPILDEVINGSTHNVAGSLAERLYSLDILTQAGGDGDLAVILMQALKIDAIPLDAMPDDDSVAGKLNTIQATLDIVDRQILVSLNINATTVRVEAAVEQYGIIETTPWVQCNAQIFDEANSIIETIGIVDFGAIGPRGFFAFDWTSHTLLAGHSYQIRITISDGATDILTTTKPFKVLQV